MESTNLPQGYTVLQMRGQEVAHDQAFIKKLSSAWAISYRQSTEHAQRNDKKYTKEKEQERIDLIKKELSAASSELIIITQKDEIIGFFWGMSVADLIHIAPEKSAHVTPYITSDPKKTAYLSVLGVIYKTQSDTGELKHTGRGFGKILTAALCQRFKNKGFLEAIARTINPLALQKVYQALGFTVKNEFFDEQSKATRYIFGKML